MKQFRLFSLVVLCTVFAAASFAQEKFTLQYKFEKGKTYRYHDVMKGVTTQEMMGREMKIDNGMDATARLIVEDASKTEGYTIISSPEAATISMKSAMADTTIVLNQVIDKRTKIFLSPTGAVIRREIIDSVKIEGMRGATYTDPLKIHETPGKPVAAAEVWKISRIDSADKMGGKIITTTAMEYSVVGTEAKGNRKCIKVAYTGKLTITGSGKMMGMEFFMEGSGTVKGAYFFDAKAGLMIADENDTNFDMTMAATGQQNITIPISQSMKLTQTLVE
jgi:hypothetical protein